MTEIRNAKIIDTTLGIEDHGIMTALIQVQYSGSSVQGFGGYTLTGKYAYEWLKRIFETLEVSEWEKLKGTYCRVEQDLGKIHKIGHLLEDKWFNPSEEWKDQP